MSINVYIPNQFRPQLGGNANLLVQGDTVKDVLASLTTQYPDFAARLYKHQASLQINRFINVYLNQENIHLLDGLSTPVKQGDELILEVFNSGG